MTRRPKRANSVVRDPRRGPRPDQGRRNLLLGAAGGLAATVLAACGGETSGSAGTSSQSAAATGTSEGAVLVASFDPNNLAVAGVENRLPFAVAGSDGVPMLDGPERLTFTIVGQGGLVGNALTVERHDDGVPIAYYPLRFTPPEAGTFAVRTELEGALLEQALRVNPTSPTGLVQPGQALVEVATPTVEDPLGTDPLCTRRPEPCPLHDIDLRAAMASGRPTAIAFSTPQFCSTGVCGPTLELLLEEVENHPSIQFIHCEIYTSPPTAGVSLVEAVDAFGLTYEPAMYVADASNTVVQRLDNVFDRAEIRAALGAVTA